jgi:CCR4-NOT transcription complex subunit 2
VSDHMARRVLLDQSSQLDQMRRECAMHISYRIVLTSCYREFPSLSNNQTQPSQSTWAAPGSRTMGSSGNLRLQQAALSAQQQLNAQQQTQQQQDDLFNSSSQLPSSQGGFRFGSQNAVGQVSQSNSVDEFPPLNRNANGEIGPDRGSSIMQNSGFNNQSNGLGFGSTNPPQTSRNNGLLNALSGSSRLGNRIASPTSLSGG